MSRTPEIKWAQHIDKVYITVQLPDARDVKVNLEPDGIFTFSATAGVSNNFYELKLELFDKVNKEESKINIGVRSIFCVIEKAQPQWWKKLLHGEGKTPHYVKVDWDKWVDEDDDGRPDLDLGGMDFSVMATSDISSCNFNSVDHGLICIFISRNLVIWGEMLWMMILKIVMMKSQQKKLIMHLEMRRPKKACRMTKKKQIEGCESPSICFCHHCCGLPYGLRKHVKLVSSVLNRLREDIFYYWLSCGVETMR